MKRGMRLMNIAKKGLEMLKERLQKQIECSKDRSLPIFMTFGYKELGLKQNATLRQKNDGNTYFEYDTEHLYRIVHYEWQGPLHEMVMTANTTGASNSTTTKKGKSGRIAIGAIIGTILFPVVGTVVGAAVGAGGKGKWNTQNTNQSTTQQINKQVEENSTAILKFQNIITGVVYSSTIVCNTNINSLIQCFQIDKNQSISTVSKNATDALKGVKALKELLDMGAITVEEFEIKKKQILEL